MPISILNFKWAWQAQFLSHTPVTLKFTVFFIDVQMILVSFFEILNQKSVNQEKPISFYQLRTRVAVFFFTKKVLIICTQQVQAKSSQVIYQKNYPNQSKAIFQYLYMSQKHG